LLFRNSAPAETLALFSNKKISRTVGSHALEANYNDTIIVIIAAPALMNKAPSKKGEQSS
jgi:hypothetical protein